MVYDARDRLVMTQDGKTRAEDPNKWFYTKYEEFNRPVETGFMTTEFDFESLKANFENTIEFADFNFPEVLTQTQYDTYPNAELCTLTGRNNAVNGQVTFQKAKILDQSGQYRESYFFYDSKYRLIQTIVTGGDLINQSTVNTYDFAGRVIESIETYSGQTSQSVHRWFTYDHAGRLEKTEQQIGSDARVVLAQNDYNELGQMMLKKLHSASDQGYVQDMDYSYNIQGWLTGINSLEDASFRKLYAQMLGYNPNGNIQSIAWKNNRPNGTNPVEQGNRQKYLFTYDGLNRLDKAEYSEFDQLRQLITAREGFFNEDPEYDLNGNIVSLLRKGSTDALGTIGGTIDDLAYTYKTNSNQLRKVTDGVAGALAHDKHFISASTSDYAYDQNGNATFVPNKRDTIRYNYLNLPEKMTIVGQGTISYLYDASGNKLMKSYDPLTGPTVDSYYQGSVLLTGGKVIVLNGEGRSVKNSTSWDYEYDLKDHLGNTRISFLADNGQVSALQVKDYYPFGMEMTNGQSIAGDPTKYLYNGKELQDEAGLDFYDYGARFYDPAIGRWNTLDPKANKYYSISPYVYCADDPILYIDPDGQKIEFANGVSPQFKKDFATAVKYLNKHQAGGMLNALQKSKTTYYIKEVNGGSSYSPKDKTISWDSSKGLFTNELHYLSPTTVLNHEVDHALQHDQNPDKQKADGKIPDPDYTNKEEKRVVEGSEQETAKKLGEIKEGEVTRKDHGGRLFETTDPTSTKDKNEVTIVGQNNKNEDEKK